jgi:hypothetical protein
MWNLWRDRKQSQAWWHMPLISEKARRKTIVSLKSAQVNVTAGPVSKTKGLAT